MARRRVLILMKPFDVYPPRHRAKDSSSSFLHRTVSTQILSHLDDRCRVHKEGINFCQDVLRRKNLDWEPLFRNNISHPIRGVDLVVTVGGDGTLLQASHLIDNSIPVLGVNSDPTQPEEVEQFCEEFDATRSTGYLCAATIATFEQILEEVLEGKNKPFELARISTKLNERPLPAFALNDVLLSHPCPATVSRFSFGINYKNQKGSSLVNSRSSGLRICTAAGSTAAMLSAGGFPMPISSSELQFMEASAYFFCLEDRAILCRNCDVSVHTANPCVSIHQRFLLTGVQVGLESTGSVPSFSKEQSNSAKGLAEQSPKRPTSSPPAMSYSGELNEFYSNEIAEDGRMGPLGTFFGGAPMAASITEWPLDEFFRFTDFNQNYDFTDNGSSKADSGKLGSSEGSPMNRSFDEVMEAEECLGQVPEMPSPPTSSGLNWPRNSRYLVSDNAAFVPDISSWQNPHQARATLSRRKRSWHG